MGIRRTNVENCIGAFVFFRGVCSHNVKISLRNDPAAEPPLLHDLRKACLCSGRGFESLAGGLPVTDIVQQFVDTMTVFYVLLYYVWRERYHVRGRSGLTAAVFVLAGLRVLLCMMPQNDWLSPTAPLSWGILRNIPFALLGLLIIVLFFQSASHGRDRAFRWMWLTIVLSFAFYIPVVLFADRFPMIGMLMIPKTCAYVWTVVIGYRSMKQDAFT